MKTVVSSLHFTILAGEAPEWVHLTPAGTFRGIDGRGPFTLENPDDVIRASMSAGKLPLDENHSTDKAAPEGRPSPARGWIVEMQMRSDGLWGRVEWTSAGAEMLKDKAYRGISPVLMSTQAGKLLKILRASLVNDPNLTLTTLHSRENDMDFLAKLRKAIGLKDDATEDAALAAVTSHAAIAAAAGKVALAGGLKADASGDEIVTHLNTRATADPKLVAVKVGLKAAGVDFDQASAEQITAHFKAPAGDAELRTAVITLQSQLTTLQSETAKEKATLFVDAAISAGKPIRPLREHYIDRHQKDAAAVEKEIGALVSIHGGGIVQAPKQQGALAEGASVNEIMAAASLHQAEQAKAGITISSTDAILHVTGRS
jgi:phage I-like protein